MNLWPFIEAEQAEQHNVKRACELLRIASRRLLLAKTTAAADVVVLATERELKASQERELPSDFRRWPVEQRSQWFRERSRRYADAWRGRCKKRGDC